MRIARTTSRARERRGGPRRARPTLTLALLTLAVALSSARWPEVSQREFGPALLRGIPGVAVHAEQVHSEVRSLGLTGESLRARLIAALERDSIPVLSSWDARSRSDQPFLVVRLETVSSTVRGVFAWHLSLALQQVVRSARSDSVAALATTWQAYTSLGVTSGSLLRASVESTLDDQAREFAAAWRERDRTPR